MPKEIGYAKKGEKNPSGKANSPVRKFGKTKFKRK